MKTDEFKKLIVMANKQPAMSDSWLMRFASIIFNSLNTLH